MLSETKSELENLMNRYKDDLSGLQSKREDEKDAQSKFDQEFERLKHEVIWPVFVEVGNELNQYGHDYHVSEEKEYVDATASYKPSVLVFNIYPATVDRAFYKPESTPYIAFVANKYARKIGIEVSTIMPNMGGVTGSHGEYSPEGLTKELVEKEIVNVLKNTLIFHR